MEGIDSAEFKSFWTIRLEDPATYDGDPIDPNRLHLPLAGAASEVVLSGAAFACEIVELGNLSFSIVGMRLRLARWRSW